MLTDDLTAALAADALAAGAPPADLLHLVRRRAARQRRRKAAALGLSGVLAVGLLGTTVLALRPAHRSTVLSVQSTPTIEPAGQTESPQTDGLTGSICDDPGSAEPVRYLNWPCAKPQAGTVTNIENTVFGYLNNLYPGLTAPRVRLLADDTQSAGGRAFYEFWDADHLATPPVIGFIDKVGDESGGLVPAGNPDLVAFIDDIAVRAPITSVTLEPAGKVVPIAGGTATISRSDSEAATSIVGHDATGQTRAGWTIPHSRDQLESVDSLCAGHEGTGTCGDGPAASPPSDLCQSPSGTSPARYLDWPCAGAADATTPERVAQALQFVLAHNRGIKDPQVRLLADTRDLHDGVTGPTATLVEVWDAAGTGPALVSSVHGTPGKLVSTTGIPPAGDPALLVKQSIQVDDTGRADELTFARSDVSSVSIEEAGTMISTPVSGGAAVLHFTGFDVKHPDWSYQAVGGDGTVLATVPFDDPAYVDPCAGVLSSTCVPSGTEPSFPASASASANASPSP